MENNTAVPATRRKAAQRQRQAALGIQRVEVKLSARERETLAALCRLRAPSGDPYTADEYISTLIRRDMERYQTQLQALDGQHCQHCNNPLPQGCGGAFDGEHACWRTQGNKTLTL